MNIRKLNEIFGYGLFLVGALKILLLILVLAQIGTNITAIFNGENVNPDYYPTFSTTIGFAQLILAFGSIIMIILNVKNKPEVIPGYVLGIGALLIEFITPSIMSFYMVFIECGMYMKAGSRIRNKNFGYERQYKTTRKMIKNTEWFYSDKKEQDKKDEQIEIKKQKRIAKLNEEIEEWKKLLDSGEIDEETYNEETNRLIEKERRIKNNLRRK